VKSPPFPCKKPISSMLKMRLASRSYFSMSFLSYTCVSHVQRSRLTHLLVELAQEGRILGYDSRGRHALAALPCELRVTVEEVAEPCVAKLQPSASPGPSISHRRPHSRLGLDDQRCLLLDVMRTIWQLHVECADDVFDQGSLLRRREELLRLGRGSMRLDLALPSAMQRRLGHAEAYCCLSHVQRVLSVEDRDGIGDAQLGHVALSGGGLAVPLGLHAASLGLPRRHGVYAGLSTPSLTALQRPPQGALSWRVTSARATAMFCCSLALLF
jgi:hypothetical protein